MIVNGTPHGSGRKLAAYLQARGDNDLDPELFEQTAYMGMSLDFALRALQAEAIGTRSTRPLYHGQISPAPGEHLTREQFMEAIKLYEEEMGFEGLSRAVVFHTKNGQEHAHVAWGRIDPVTNTARPYVYDYKKHERIARILETRFNLRQVQGKWCKLDGTYFTPEELRQNARQRRQEQPKQTNRAEQAQESRGAKPKGERQEEITRLWHATKTGRELRTALEIAGYTLARGDRRAYVVVDRAGEVHSLARQIHGVTAKDVAARLVDVNLPSVQEVRDAMRRTAKERSPLAQDSSAQSQAPQMAKREPEATHGPAHEHGGGSGQEQGHNGERREQNHHAATPESTAALEDLTQHHSTFTHRDLERYARENTETLPEAAELVEAVEEHPDLIHLGEDRTGRERFTSRDMLKTELAMEAAAEDLAAARRHRVHPRVQDAVPNIDRLSEEQGRAYRQVLGPEGLSIIEGHAGTGKSYMLGAARKAWVAAGYRVHGAALSGIAAEGLQTGSQIESRTLHSMLGRLQTGKLQLNDKDIIVLDEAGMVGSRQMSELLTYANNAHAKVVLVGDSEQLQAIEAGGAFRALKDRHGAVTLTDIRRQGIQWQRAATAELATERTDQALERYRKHGMVHEAGSRAQAKDEMVAAWTASRAAHPDEKHIMLAYTRADVAELNERAREAYRTEKRLGEDHQVVTTDRDGVAHRTKLAAGDRVYFMRNDTRLGVKNGTLATVTAVEGKQLSVQLDDGRKLSLDTRDYNTLAHGYAATVHKSQGVTVDRTHMLASRFVDRHAAYVGMSRHRKQADLYWSREEFRGFDRLTRSMSRDQRKDTTLDYLARAEKGKQPPRESLRRAAADIWQKIKGAFRFQQPPPKVEPTFKRETVQENAPPRVDPKHARETVRAPAQRINEQSRTRNAEAIRQENARRQQEQEQQRQTR